MLVRRAALHAGGGEAGGSLRRRAVALTGRPQRGEKLPARHTLGLLLESQRWGRGEREEGEGCVLLQQTEIRRNV